MSKYADYNTDALTAVFADLDQKRKTNLDYGKNIEDQRDLDLMKIKAQWRVLSQAERASPEGERYLVHWQARRAHWAQMIQKNTDSINPLMEEYHGVRALLKERGVKC